jgi:hypothetical protein
MSFAHLGFELGMAVSDYNSGTTTTYDDIVKYTFLYLEEVKRGVADGTIHMEELADYYIIVGQAWASIHPKPAESGS